MWGGSHLYSHFKEYKVVYQLLYQRWEPNKPVQAPAANDHGKKSPSACVAEADTPPPTTSPPAPKYLQYTARVTTLLAVGKDKDIMLQTAMESATV